MLPSNSDVSDDSSLKRKVGRFDMKNRTKFSRLSSRDMYHSTTLTNYTQKSFAISECPEFLSSITQPRNLSINTMIYDSAYFSLHPYLATHKQRLIVLRNVILFVKAILMYSHRKLLKALRATSIRSFQSSLDTVFARRSRVEKKEAKGRTDTEDWKERVVNSWEQIVEKRSKWLCAAWLHVVARGEAWFVGGPCIPV